MIFSRTTEVATYLKVSWDCAHNLTKEIDFPMVDLRGEMITTDFLIDDWLRERYARAVNGSPPDKDFFDFLQSPI